MLSLTEKYRPQHLADLLGQPEAVAVLSAFVRNPYPAAFLLHGYTGTGKTSAALALARELGCNVSAGEFGGLNEIASGEQSADGIREMFRRLHLIPFSGSGWRVLVVNEADRMSTQAETVWLDILERLPNRSVVVFSTNNLDSIPRRLRDRCECLEFRSSLDDLKPALRDLALRVWQAETGRTDAPNVSLGKVVDSGQVSFRRLIQALGPMIRCPELAIAAPAPTPAPAPVPVAAPAGQPAAWWQQRPASARLRA